MSSKYEWPSENISPENLLAFAREAAENSYAPYSRFHVGSAILLENDEVIQSCNVENASYSLTICAERAGIAMMISRGKKNPLAIAIAASHEDRDDYMTVPGLPCGACRQVLAEFNPDILIVLASENEPEIITLRDLLPRMFSLRP